MHGIEVIDEAVEVEVEVLEQVDLVDQHQLAGAEHQRVLERLVLALGDRRHHHARVLADAELSWADEVADVLDHQQVDVVQRQRRQPGSVFSCVTGTCSAASRSASALPCTSPSSTPTRTPGSAPTVRSRSAVLPAPGALIRLTATTPARSRSARLTAAIVSLASRTPSTTLIFVLCMRLHRLHLEIALDLG